MKENIKKIVSVLLILALIITNSSLLLSYLIREGISYASNMEIQSNVTNNKNVEFDAFFIDKQNSIHHQSEIKIGGTQEIYVNVNIKNGGYIKNAYIEFMDSKDSHELNYLVSSKNNDNDKLQKIEEYKVELKQLNVGNFIAEILIEGSTKDRMPLEYLDQESKAVFKGTYVDVQGKEIEIEKEITLHTQLKSDYAPEVLSTMLGYKVYEKEIMSGEENKTETKKLEIDQEVKIIRKAKELPIKKTVVSVVVPEIEGVKPTNVVVIAKTLGYTNGQMNELVLFGETNYQYNKDTGEVIITVENNEQGLTAWAGTGEDNYIIIYKYENILNTEAIGVKKDVTVHITTYENKELNYSVSDVVANNISLINDGKVQTEIEAITKEVLKGKLYANIVNENKPYEVNYSLAFQAMVKDIEDIEKIEIEAPSDFLVGEGEASGWLDSYYKSIKVLKSNMENILGSDGIVIVRDTLGSELGRIDNTTKIDKNGYYELEIVGAPDFVKIETSKPEKEGILYLIANKLISKKLEYTQKELKEMDAILSGIKTDSGRKEVRIPLIETETRVTMSVNKNTLTEKEEHLEILLNLNNHNEKSDLYKNPKFTIELPSYIKNIVIDNTNIVFNSGDLGVTSSEIKTNKDGTKKIEIQLNGTQIEYPVNATIVAINVSLEIIDHVNEEQEIKLYYKNESANQYVSEVEVLKLKAMLAEGVTEDNKPILTPISEPENKVFDISMGIYEPPIETSEEEQLNLEDNPEIDYTKGVESGTRLLYSTTIKNISANTINQVVASVKIPEGLTYETDSGNLVNGEENNDGKLQFNDITKNLTINIGTMEANAEVRIDFFVTVNELKEDETRKEINVNFSVVGEGTEEHESNPIDLKIGEPAVSPVASIKNPDKKYKQNETIEYSLLLRSVGGKDIDNAEINISIPSELKVLNMNYGVKEIETDTAYIYYLEKTSPKNDIKIYDISMPEEGVFILNMKLQISENVEIKEGYKQLQIPANIIVKKETTKEGTEEEDPEIIYTIVSNETINTNVFIARDDYSDDPSDNYIISGIAWIDENENGQIDTTEKKLEKIKVKAIDQSTGIAAQETITDSNGRYQFKKLVPGNYQVVFEYDDLNYDLTIYRKKDIDDIYDSDVVTMSNNFARTEDLKIENTNIYGINMGLVKSKIFDLRLDKSITKIILQTKNGTITYPYNQSKLAKIEIPAKELSSATVLIEYVISIKNLGQIRGVVNKIVDYIPSNMIFSSELNANWYQGADGNLYNEELSDEYINPGESKEIRLVLKKQMTETNTGLINNTAEIYEAKNEKGLADINSTPANKKQNENDISIADCIIGVKTGQEVIYISLSLVLIIILGTGMYLIKKKVI